MTAPIAFRHAPQRYNNQSVDLDQKAFQALLASVNRGVTRQAAYGFAGGLPQASTNISPVIPLGSASTVASTTTARRLATVIQRHIALNIKSLKSSVRVLHNHYVRHFCAHGIICYRTSRVALPNSQVACIVLRLPELACANLAQCLQNMQCICFDLQEENTRKITAQTLQLGTEINLLSTKLASQHAR